MKQRNSHWFLSPDVIFSFVCVVIMALFWQDVFTRAKSYDAVLLTCILVASVLCFCGITVGRYQTGKRRLAEIAENNPSPAAAGGGPLEAYKKIFTRKQFIIVAFLVGYFILISVIGFLLSTAAFLILLQRLLGRREWKGVLMVAIISALVIDLAFGQLFMIKLPMGLLNIGLGAIFG